MYGTCSFIQMWFIVQELQLEREQREQSEKAYEKLQQEMSRHLKKCEVSDAILRPRCCSHDTQLSKTNQ